jgi:hypothetical protein
VTARRFPAEPRFASHAEQLFVEFLQENLPDDVVLFCGQRFSDREQDREADVIVAWPGVGIAVIEVKGGSVYLQHREWHQVGDGVDTVIHPVDQAVACKYLLRDYLEQHPRWSGGRPRLQHLVALPGTTLPDDFWVSDLPRWMVLDRTDLPYAASRVEAALRKLAEAPDPPTAADVDDLVDCLAGAAIPQRDLIAQLAEREAACDLLTREQADVLDRLALLNRVEIRGGAGSGKTWLAVEKARRLAKEGKRVALMCYSRGLAEYLTRRVATLRRRERPAYVGTFHNLGIGWGVEPGSGRRQPVLGGVPARRDGRPGRSAAEVGAVRRDRHRRGAGLR